MQPRAAPDTRLLHHYTGHLVRSRIQSPDAQHTSALRLVHEVGADTGDPHGSLPQDFRPLLVGDGHHFTEYERSDGEQGPQQNDGDEQTVKGHSARLCGRDLLVACHVANGEHGRHQRGDRDGILNEEGQLVHVGKSYLAEPEAARKVLVQIVGHVDDHEEQGQPQYQHQKRAEELPRNVAVEQLGHPCFLPNRSRSHSASPPPRAVDISRPIRLSPHKPSAAKIAFIPHIATTGGTCPASPRASPAIKLT